MSACEENNIKVTSLPKQGGHVIDHSKGDDGDGVTLISPLAKISGYLSEIIQALLKNAALSTEMYSKGADASNTIAAQQAADIKSGANSEASSMMDQAIGMMIGGGLCLGALLGSAVYAAKSTAAEEMGKAGADLKNIDSKIERLESAGKGVSGEIGQDDVEQGCLNQKEQKDFDVDIKKRQDILRRALKNPENKNLQTGIEDKTIGIRKVTDEKALAAMEDKSDLVEELRENRKTVQGTRDTHHNAINSLGQQASAYAQAGQAISQAGGNLGAQGEIGDKGRCDAAATIERVVAENMQSGNNNLSSMSQSSVDAAQTIIRQWNDLIPTNAYRAG